MEKPFSKIKFFLKHSIYPFIFKPNKKAWVIILVIMSWFYIGYYVIIRNIESNVNRITMLDVLYVY